MIAIKTTMKIMPEYCDDCIYYSWYYDHCHKWDCDTDNRSVCAAWLYRPIQRQNETAASKE